MNLSKALQDIDKLNFQFLLVCVAICGLLYWTALAKFPAPDLIGASPAVKPNPYTDWDKTLTTVIHPSWLVGIAEIAAATLVALGNWNTKLGMAGCFLTMWVTIAAGLIVVSPSGAIHWTNGFWSFFSFEEAVLLGGSIYLMVYFSCGGTCRVRPRGRIFLRNRPIS